ncbi:MAG: Asp-tRNA(Asn)/Glu-tRNA(Gln) amidotransferase subunit GatC [Oscillospiraceae bacterium]|nr:Asp-tRNA(Asn)/Glu-tRNA(Gln) amidotransferase subunit GatC [Oscillospiraceae bacterium]
MVDRKAIMNIAKLFMDESETDDVTEQMDNIIQFANEIQNVDVKGSDFDNINGLVNVLRSDEVTNSVDRELILKNANDTKDGYFCIKKSK